MRTTRINTLTQVFTSVPSVNSVVKHVFLGSNFMPFMVRLHLPFPCHLRHSWLGMFLVLYFFV